MNDIFQEFCNNHHANIQPTDRNIVRRGAFPNSFSHPLTQAMYEPHEIEKVIAIYLPESEAKKVITEMTNLYRERELMNRDSRLYKLYMEYKLWLEMIR